jgi:hypothetical protein
MNPALLAQLERLAAANISILPTPEVTSHFVLERAGFVVLAERNDAGFGAVGSPGLLMESGFAALVTRNGADWFVGKSEARAAAPEEAALARGLYKDLREILG